VPPFWRNIIAFQLDFSPEGGSGMFESDDNPVS